MITFRLSENRLPGPAFTKTYRGGLTYVLDRGLFLPEQASALTAVSRTVLNQVALYQMWQGEFVDLGDEVEEPSLLHGVSLR